LKRVLLGLVLTIIGVSGWGQDYSDYPPDIRAIKERGYIIVAMHPTNFRPYMIEEYLPPQTPGRPEPTPLLVGEDPAPNLVGHELDMARKVANALGVGLVLDREASSFNDIPRRVAEGYADVAISLLSRNLARAQFVRFTDPYIIVRPTIVISQINASRFNLNPLDPVGSLGLTAQRAAAPEGNAYVDYIEELFPGLEILKTDGWTEVFESVLDLDKRVTFGLRSEVGVANFLFENRDEQLNLLTLPLTDPKYADPLAMAVHPDSVHLLHWLNIFIAGEGGAKTGQELLEAYAVYYE
jgi:polar amino acid transport system substrate-binding protein